MPCLSVVTCQETPLVLLHCGTTIAPRAKVQFCLYVCQSHSEKAEKNHINVIRQLASHISCKCALVILVARVISRMLGTDINNPC